MREWICAVQEGIPKKWEIIAKQELVRCKDCEYAWNINPDEEEKFYVCMNPAMVNMHWSHHGDWYCGDGKRKTANDKLVVPKRAVVHPETSCTMEYITVCCCDLCGVQLIKYDNFCRGCGKPIDWGDEKK